MKNYIPGTILLMLCIGTAEITKAQTSMQTTTARALSETQKSVRGTVALNHIARYVHDLKTSTTFYRDVMGFQQIEEPFKLGKHAWFTLGAAGQLHLIAGEKSGMAYDKNSHICFSIPSMDDFIENLKANQVAFEDWPGTSGGITLRVDGVQQIYFQDPDGHWLEVNDDKTVFSSTN